MSDRTCILSFFAGSGFLYLGFETSGFNIVYVKEIFLSFMAGLHTAIDGRLSIYHCQNQGMITEVYPR